jgi:hypothetical protein
MESMNWRLLGFDARDDERECRDTPIPEDIRERML